VIRPNAAPTESKQNAENKTLMNKKTTKQNFRLTIGKNGCVLASKKGEPLKSLRDSLMVLPLFREDQWEAILASGALGLDDTWEDWNNQGKEIIALLEEKHIQHVQIPVDVDELNQYCKEQGIPNDSRARQDFLGVKHEQMKKPVVCAKVSKDRKEVTYRIDGGPVTVVPSLGAMLDNLKTPCEIRMESNF
jgi:hypothetical protein